MLDVRQPQRAQELRERIRKGRGVSKRAAAAALDEATAALITGSGGTETIEFVTWSGASARST